MEFSAFHDSCLRQLLVNGETFVAENLGMSCSAHLETSALLFLQSQNRHLPAVELKCERVTGIRITPSPDGCDSIIMNGNITKQGEGYRLALYFMGAPLQGEPNSSISVFQCDEPDIEITSQAMAWRSLPRALGEPLIYVPRQID